MNDTLTTLLFLCATLLALLAVSFAVVVIVRDVGSLRRQRAQGEGISWYKQPTIINALAQLLLWSSLYLNVLALLGRVERWLYLVVVLGLVCAIALSFYALKLARALPKRRTS